ncbi:epidermal growth factor receptor substrate15-like 1 [Striga asiatica]|uniref:Epidermal growth factor receptor substrate15-like 1 n=1 Tax=Striga asiatica TaxID=4170 RepID=A0A5A7PDD6_STRAF|nr:epidermal growth factor receptor substrate15-like 1 [Striga asiatica]
MDERFGKQTPDVSYAGEHIHDLEQQLMEAQQIVGMHSSYCQELFNELECSKVIIEQLEAQLNQVEHHADHYYQQHQMEQDRCKEMEQEVVDKEVQIVELDSKVKNLELELKVKDDAMARMEAKNQRLCRRVSLGAQRIDILECQIAAERLIAQQSSTSMGPQPAHPRHVVTIDSSEEDPEEDPEEYPEEDMMDDD